MARFIGAAARRSSTACARAQAHALSRRIARGRGGADDGRQSAGAVRGPHGRPDLGRGRARRQAARVLLSQGDRAGRRGRPAVDLVPGDLDRRLRLPEGPGRGSGFEGDRRSAGQGAYGPASAAGVFQRRRSRPVRPAPADSPDPQFIRRVHFRTRTMSRSPRDLVSFCGWKVHPTL